MGLGPHDEAGVVGPHRPRPDEDGVAARPDGLDPVLGIPRLKDAFERRFPGYPKGITVPAIVDVPSGKVVTNDYPQITLDLSTEWTAHHRDGAAARRLAPLDAGCPRMPW